MIGLTGSTGFIGAHVRRWFTQHQKPVRLLVRNPEKVTPRPKTEHEQLCPGNLLQENTLSSFCQGLETLVHLAGIVKGQIAGQVSQVNSEGTRNLVRVAVREGVEKIIYISSGGIDFYEGEYSSSKRKAERWVRESGLHWVIVRPSEIYGPGDHSGITILIPKIKRWPFFPIIGDGSYQLQPLLVDDLAAALGTILTSFETCQAHTINLAGPDPLSFAQIIDTIAAQLGRKVRKIYIPPKVALLAATILNRIPLFALTNPDQIKRVLISKQWDISTAQHLLHFQPVDFETGLKRVLVSMSGSV